jgi:hypothetical protein
MKSAARPLDEPLHAMSPPQLNGNSVLALRNKQGSLPACLIAPERAVTPWIADLLDRRGGPDDARSGNVGLWDIASMHGIDAKQRVSHRRLPARCWLKGWPSRRRVSGSQFRCQRRDRRPVLWRWWTSGLFPTEQATRSPLGIVSLDRIDEIKGDDNDPIQKQP